MRIRKIDTMDKRLAELERELRQVRRTMRATAKQSAMTRRPPAFASPPPASETGPADDPAPADPDARHGELFAYAHREPGGNRPLPDRSIMEKRQFAHYFASGSFVGGIKPPRETRRLQRNKAIFMVVVVLIVAFVLYSLFR